MSAPSVRPRRDRGAFETVVCGAIVALIALHALWRMDYLSARGAHTVRLTDNSRSAYVAKNLADGNGYTTNDLPAALVDYYDDHGKLHAARWDNADRFPFTAYAIAALYELTGSTSYRVGILLYNLLCWIAFLVVLHRLATTIWGDRYSGVFALGIALLHPYTYMYLYAKDADTLLLTTACLGQLYRYFGAPARTLGWRWACALGTLLGWTFLARPNLGAAFAVFFAGVAVRRAWAARRELGAARAARALLAAEGVVAAVAIAWVVPFAAQTMAAWGTPLFSANGIYQLPLGTRFAMETDTWWKYTEPHHAISVANLFHDDPGAVIAKFTTSWLVTFKYCVRSYAIELFLAVGLAAWFARRRARAAAVEESTTDGNPRPVRLLVWLTVFAVVVNLAVLPLYSYQRFNWRHYLGFGLPMLWLAAGHAVYRLGVAASPAWTRAIGHVRDHAAGYLLAAIAAFIAWNVGTRAPDGNALFARTSYLVGTYWVTAVVLLGGLLGARAVARTSTYARVVAVVAAVVVARYQPDLGTKLSHAVWFSASDRVGDVLRQRHGLVSSLALQGEVAWMSDRQNIPAPELVAHLYSYVFDHRLELEDIYIESAASLLAPDGVFGRAAPGFEGYARLQRFDGRLPGYERVLHDTAVEANPRFKVTPREKTASIYRLVDPAARDAFGASPAELAVGDVANVVYTAYGFGDYYTLDGKPVVAATDAARRRYPAGVDQPYADTAIAFFLDARHPDQVELELYVPAATTIDVYWNLDLFAYDRAVDRDAHRIGRITSASPGWQTVRLAVPPALTRTGVNLVSLAPRATAAWAVCPLELTDELCLQLRPRAGSDDPTAPARPWRLAGATAVSNQRIYALISTLRFHYPR